MLRLAGKAPHRSRPVSSNVKQHTTPLAPPPALLHKSRLGTFLHGSYALLVVLVFGGALYAWRLRCEGFGCIGVGIVWAAWAAVLFAPALALGAFLAAKSGPRGVLARLTRWALGMQLALGAVLAVTWLAIKVR